MFTVFIWFFACMRDGAYVQMCANKYRCMLHCISMSPM